MTGRPAALRSLVKPRIVGLLSVTGASALLAAGGTGPLRFVAFLLAGGSIAAGAAALNCYYDRDLDRLMERTADRPLPSGDLDPRIALAFALGLLVAGTLVGVAALPAVAVVHMLLGAFAYVGLYTVLLKRRHWLGVVLGGSAGSFPVLAGWTAARPLSLAPVVMAAVVFAWTPAHAWALAYVYRDDFAAASVPTLPAVADGRRVRRAVWLSALAAVATAGLAVPLAGPTYAVALAVAAPPFLFAFASYRRTGTEPAAVRAFFTSNLLVAVLFAAWAAGGIASTVPAPALLVEAGVVVALFGLLWRARPQLRGVRAAAFGTWGRPIELLERVLPGDRPE